MSRIPWQEWEPLLETALDLPDGEQTKFIAAQCAGNPALEKRLRELLRSARSDGLLKLPAETGPFGMAGPYELLRPIGTGGMGEVWLARRADGAFDKRVAIKLIRHGYGQEDLIRRFEVERQVLAWLEHPSIARLVDGGVLEDGRPYIAMEYVEGRQIDTYCSEENLSLDERVRLFLEVTDGVQHAHEHGVIHRDIKPSNVLVDETGRPRLLDFGIAKVLTGEEGAEQLELTRTGQRMYSPLYASPEQVRGESVGVATDIYSLGMMLCELLSGSRPYNSPVTSQLELERVVCETSPARPSDLVKDRRARQDLRGGLDWIVAAAIRKEPERRFANVGAMTADLRRYLAHERVLVRPDSVDYRLRVYVRRNKEMVLGSLALFIGLAISLVLWRRSVGVAQESQQVAYASTLQGAEMALRSGHILVAKQQLDSSPPNLRAWEWQHLRSRLNRGESLLPNITPPDGGGGVAVSPDGSWLAVRSAYQVNLWNYETLEPSGMRSIRMPSIETSDMLPAISVNFHPLQPWIVLAGRDGVARILDLESLETRMELKAGDGHMYYAQFDPLGKWLVCAMRTGELVVFGMPGGTELARRQAHDPGDLRFTFDRSGERLVSASWDERTCVWSLPELERLHELSGHERWVSGAAFVGDGDRVVTVSTDGTARVCRLDGKGEAQVFRGHSSAVLAMEVASDGHTIFSSEEGGRILRWDSDTLEILGVHNGHRMGARSLEIDTEGRLLSIGYDALRLMRWEPDVQDVQTLTGCEYQGALSIDPTGSEFAIAGPDGLVYRWDLTTLEPLAFIRAGATPLVAVRYSASADQLLSVSSSGSVRCWGLPGLEPIREWQVTTDTLRNPTIGPGERWIVFGEEANWTVGLNRACSLEYEGPVAPPSRELPGSYANSECWGQVLFLFDEGQGVVWRINTDTWERTVELETTGALSLACDWTEGRLLVGYKNSATLWEEGMALWTCGELTGSVQCAAFHPTQPRIALGTSSGQIEILDSRDGRRLLFLTGHTSSVRDLEFTFDGQRLLSCSADGTTRVWGTE